MSAVRYKVDKLTEDNYATWCRQMQNCLILSLLWSAIEDGSDDLPPAERTVRQSDSTADSSQSSEDVSVQLKLLTTEDPPPLQPVSKDIDARAKATIELNVSDRLLHMIPRTSTAKQAWDILARAFSSRMQARQLNLRAQLIGLRFEPKEGVTAFVNNFLRISDMLTAAGGGLAEKDLRLTLLQQLYQASSLRPILETILYDETLTIPDIVARLQATEARLAGISDPAPTSSKDKDTDTSAKAFTAAAKVKCSHCKRTGHDVSECRKLKAKLAKTAAKDKDGEATSCTYCGKSNHTTETCYKRKDDLQAASGSSLKAVAFSALLLSSSLPTASASACQPVGVKKPSNLMNILNRKYVEDVPAALTTSADEKRPYDYSDFQLEDTYFNALEQEFGPFDLDGAADRDGTNSHLTTFYSKDNSFLDADVSGKTIWLNPPFRSIPKFLSHYLYNKMKNPENTSAVIVVPHDPTATWWPLLFQMTQVRHWAAGMQLFTLPGLYKSDPRRRLQPCSFPVAVFYDAPSKETPERYAALHAVAQPTLVVDSGASHHMTHLRQHLHDFVPVEAHMLPRTVQGAGGLMSVAGSGTLILACDNTPGVEVTSAGPFVTLRNVLYVPKLNTTLVSMNAVTAHGGSAVFKDDTCEIFHPASAQPVLRASRHHGSEFPQLFTVDYGSLLLPAGEAHTATTTPTQSDLWHQRLGHLGYDAILKLKPLSHGINVPDSTLEAEFKNLSSCAPCMAGRQARSARVSKKTAYADTLLYRVHADLCGPFPTESIGGCKYFLLVIDEASRFSSLIPLETKAQGSMALIHLLTKFQTFTGKQVKHLRTDMGGEFMTTELKDFVQAHGIDHEFTGGYSPESNAIAERCNRTILEKMRSMLTAAGLPDEFWAEAAYHANFLRNVSPSSHCQDATPWELFQLSPPDLSGLRIFGALAHVHIPKELRRKLEVKSYKAISLNYNPKSKMYRVYLDGEVNEKRDVMVDESKMGWPTLYPDDTEQKTDNGPHLQSSEDSTPSPPDSPKSPTQFFPDLPRSEADISRSAQPSLAASQQPLDDEALEHDSDSAIPELPAASEPRYSLRQRDSNLSYGQFYKATTASSAEPTTLHEARMSPDWHDWHNAMDEEHNALLSNGTWELVDTPPGITPLPCKWVFKVKHKPDGTIERYKARLVAGGHRQRDGIDYADVFAPVSRFATVRTLLALAAHNDWPLHSIDISNAFLNATLDTPVYMRQPEEFSNGNSNQSCKLLKTLYGLKQAPKEWYLNLSKTLEAYGFIQSSADTAMWYKPATSTSPPVYLATWVDDIIYTTATDDNIAAVRDYIMTAYKARDLGATTHHLNIYIERDRKAKTLKISQPTLIDSIVNEFNMADSNPKSIPMSPGCDISKLTDQDTPLPQEVPYAKCVGALLYLSSTTRPDLALCVSLLAKHMSKPAMRHWTYAKSVLAYLNTTKTYGITYGTSNETLQAYTDADYAACKDTRKSRTGYVFTLFGGAITWSSKQQSVVALSTAESEYIAACHTAREGIWLQRLCKDLGIDCDGPLALHADNKASIHMATNSSDTARTKHIDVAYHFLRQSVLRHLIRMVFCPSDKNPADMFTKPLASAKFGIFTRFVGMS